MVYRVLFAFLLTAALALCMGTPALAQDSHEGTFVKVKSATEFVMEDKGKEHSHTLAPDAKVIGADGKDVKLADLKKGQKIKVTTKKGDMTVATRIEVLKEKK